MSTTSTLFCLSSSANGGEILSCSDEFFAPASNLLNPKEPIRRPGYFVETGAWFDGWETRRHNREETDWVIIQLGAPGKIKRLEVDTAFFNGNEAPAVSVEGGDGTTWTTILPKSPCGPSQKHFFEVNTEVVSHLKLHQHPDGGIARFRAWGTLHEAEGFLDAASVLNGARAVKCSDEHFGVMDNLLLPGRGIDMGDGWETARSRGEHQDWVIIQLGGVTRPVKVVIDTAHFRGNFPESVEVHGGDGQKWHLIVPRSACRADDEHEFMVIDQAEITHVKLTIFPDGGVKRIRVHGDMRKLK